MDWGNHAFRRVDISTGVVTTVAGNPGPSNSGFNDGVGTAARFHIPIGAAMDKHGTVVIVVSVSGAGADSDRQHEALALAARGALEVMHCTSAWTSPMPFPIRLLSP